MATLLNQGMESLARVSSILNHVLFRILLPLTIIQDLFAPRNTIRPLKAQAQVDSMCWEHTCQLPLCLATA